ncbi:MAB_1171c family putative transporter [Amycolatopsis anabasis]|uniref:MAB_1171c family putative transporter n=1 Tax=Amycolatopsis anabasis TaxID=1840409 RepID=UPI00131E23C7|nr:MAB_1171c family putative transporter [Amycolatopsis anabasis]
MAEYAVFLVALVAAACKLLTKSGPTVPAFRYVVAVLPLGGASTAVASPETLKLMAESGLEPWPHFTFLVGNVLAMAAAYCMIKILGFHFHSAGARRRARWYGILLACCTVAMVELMLSVDAGPAHDFVTSYGAKPQVMVYQLLYLGFISAAAGEFLVIVRGYVRETPLARWALVGLQLEMAGAIVALVWTTWGMIKGVLAACHIVSPVFSNSAMGAIGAVCLVFMAAGIAWTAWSSPTAKLRRWLWSLRTVYTLAPLWRQLSVADPDKILNTSRYGGALLWAIIRPAYVLHRRIIEIRDWQFTLRAYCPREIRNWAEEQAAQRQLNKTDSNTFIEAVELITALAAHKAGHRCRDTATPPSVLEPPEPHQHGEADALRRVQALIRNGALLHELRAEPSFSFPGPTE